MNSENKLIDSYWFFYLKKLNFIHEQYESLRVVFQKQKKLNYSGKHYK